jgi:hypothetical protein
MAVQERSESGWRAAAFARLDSELATRKALKQEHLAGLHAGPGVEYACPLCRKAV